MASTSEKSSSVGMPQLDFTTFPNQIFSFHIKRKELSQIVLVNKNNVKKINNIIHPEVRLKMNKFLKKNKKKKLLY